MPTPVYKLTATDLVQKINPSNMEGYFKTGSGPGKVATAIVDGILNEMEARVNSSIPEIRRRMLDRIEGLIAVRWATEGQTKFTPPVKVGGDLQVFVNYPGNFGNGMKVFGCTQKPYSARTAGEATACTLNETTNEITLPEALSEGDHVIIDFNHDSMENCLELRMCVLELAAAEALRRWPTMSENISDKITPWENNAYVFLKRMWNADNNYKTGVQYLDKLKLVAEYETRGAAPGTNSSGLMGLIM